MHLPALVVMAFATLTIAAASTAAVTITGSEVDETDNPVAGARVIVDSAEPGGGVLAAATSDAAGVFRFEIPFPGDYQLRAKREGFFLLKNKATYLDPSTPVDIRLTHQKELSESIDVPYSPPIVDPDQTGEVKRLDGQAILNLPYAAAQDYRQALPLMPGAIQDSSGQVHFNGGDAYQTSYLLDGFDVSNPASGVLRGSPEIQSQRWAQFCQYSISQRTSVTDGPSLS